MPKELNLTPPLVEAQKMIADFLCSVTHAELDLKRLSQLIEVGQQEIERGMGNVWWLGEVPPKNELNY